MNKTVIYDGISKALNNVGVLISNDELMKENIGSLLPDSMAYISFIVELEHIFEIEIDDEYLNPNRLNMIDAVAEMILSEIENK